MRTEQLAALLTLADIHRADVDDARSALAQRDEPTASEILAAAIEHSEYPSAEGWTPAQAKVLGLELTADRIVRRVSLLADYARSGIRAVSFWDDDYPAPLREISHPPLVLIVWGATFPGSRRIAIVGTRRAGEEGRRVANEYAQHLAHDGWTIVSGLARGIDTSAHIGAIEAGGLTLGILAGHIRHVFPLENSALFDSIRVSGSLVSEITPYTAMHKGRFIERNRITSGLSKAVVVPEFHGTGGTLQQVRFAIAQGRPILTIRQGAGANPAARRGVELLLRLGAVAVSDPGEIPFAIETALAGLDARSRRGRPSRQARLQS